MWISHVTSPVLLICRQSIEERSPNSDADRRVAATERECRAGRGEGRICVEKHLGEVDEGKFLFVVMVTGSVVRSKNTSLA